MLIVPNEGALRGLDAWLPLDSSQSTTDFISIPVNSAHIGGMKVIRVEVNFTSIGPAEQ